MGEYILARGNGRHIPQEDKIFGISNRAKEAIAKKGKDNVINGTIGSLLDDDGELVVLESVDTPTAKDCWILASLRTAASCRLTLSPQALLPVCPTVRIFISDYRNCSLRFVEDSNPF